MVLSQGLLENPKTIFPSTQVIPSLGPFFTRLLKYGQESTIREKLAQAMENLDDLRIQQFLALKEIRSPLHREVIQRNDDQWLLPLALKPPAIAGHLFPISNPSVNHPFNSAYATTREIGREVEKQGGLLPLARFFGHFLK